MVLLEDCPQLTVPVAEAVGLRLTLVPACEAPFKGKSPPSCPQPKGRIHSVGWCKQELLPEGGSRGGGASVAAAEGELRAEDRVAKAQWGSGDRAA